MATMDERDIKFGSLPSSVNEANVLRLNLAKKVREIASGWKVSLLGLFRP